VEKKLKEKEDTGGTGITITIDPSDWKIDDGYGQKQPEIDIVPKCPTCEELAADAMTQAELCELFEQDLADARALEADLKRQATSAEKDLQTATDALRAFNNPKSYAESNGRRVTSSDVQAEREWAQQQWSKYKNGDMNAQQLSDRWKNGMSDAEREQAKADIRTRLEDAVAAAEQRLNDARDETKDLAAEIEQMQADADVCNAELDRLIAAWLDCEEGSCTETEEPVGLVPGEACLRMLRPARIRYARVLRRLAAHQARARNRLPYHPRQALKASLHLRRFQKLLRRNPHHLPVPPP
jgi:hypothetical protein